MFNLRDQGNNLFAVDAYGFDPISIEEYSTEPLRKVFPTVFQNQQDKRGVMSLLLCLNVVQYHHMPVKCCGNLVLFENAFVKCVSGTHSETNSIKFTKFNFNLSKVTVDDFHKNENLGVSSCPKCDSCNCGQCSRRASELSTRDENELQLIRDGLTSENKVWTVRYPWISDPSDLPDNMFIAQNATKNREETIERRGTS